MSISEDAISTIKERANILAVIGEYVSLKPAGSNYKGLCPFHSEKTPSFMVSPSKGIFHCFGCGAGGNVFGFLMKFKGISFPEAVRYLGERYGVPVESDRRGSGGEGSRLEGMYRMNALAAGFFRKKLRSSSGARALDYLAARKLSDEVLEEFGIGYAEDSWDSLFTFLKNNGFGPEEIEESGLIVKRKSSPGHYDRFRNRIMFPILDNIGRCIGFGGRTLEVGKPEIPKYLNSNENSLFHKGRYLFGLSSAQEWIRRSDSVIVVEGYVDVLRMHQEGFKHTVAPLGTALTDEQVSLITRYTRNVYLAFDSDEAGVKAASRSAMLMQSGGLDPSVVRLPAGKDPGDFFDEYERGDFELLLQDALPGIEFVVNVLAGGKKEYTANEKIVILTQLSGHYRTLKDEILRIGFLDALTKALDVQKVVLERELETLGGAGRIGGGKPRTAVSADKDVSHELHLLLLILCNPDILPSVRGRIDERDFKGRWTRVLWHALEKASGLPRWDSGTVFGYLRNQKFAEYLSGKLMNEALGLNPEAQAVDLTARLKEKALKGRLEAINRMLRTAEMENDEREINRLIIEKQACKNDLEKVRVLRASKTAL